MCIICVDLQKKKLTAREAMRNLWEMEEKMDDEHFGEVFALINSTAKEEEKESENE